MKPATTAFVVRLWLTQPPAHVSQILKLSDATETSTYISSSNSIGSEEESALTVFGGSIELATAVSSAFEYTAAGLDPSSDQGIFELWNKSIVAGGSFPWSVKPMPNRLYPMRFQFSVPPRRLGPHSAWLANAISKTDVRISKLSREIANIIDDGYRWDSYAESAFELEWKAAVQVINVGMAVGALHNMTQPLAPDESQYALNLHSIARDGALSNMCLKALTEGISHHELIWAASTLWGGASTESQGYASINESLQGVVAPHCVVLLDIIRNPLSFARNGMRGKLLTMCRGSVPLLARDPNSGFVLAPEIKHQRDRQDLIVGNVDSEDQILEIRDDLVITFEPDVLGHSPFRSHFCCWYMGNLAFEVDPITIFKNLLGNETTGGTQLTGDSKSSCDTAGKVSLRALGWMELLSCKKYHAEGGIVVLNAFDRTGWLIGMAGLAEPGKTFFQRRKEVDVGACELQDGDTVILSTVH